ncbi:MAG: hypothetical protein QOD77_1305 [Thermoplasmata archaeon]|jgi:predicted DCC family thiol-disulfide oxidoreductase YuxK|nr:hypothetical protein [Thermoplasmata archaeon]
MQPLTVLIDGECALCKRAAAYGMGKGRPGALRFVANTDPEADAILERFRLLHIREETMVAFDGNRAYTHSAAAVQVAKRLRWPYRAQAAVWLVPKPVRDVGYRWVARRRKRTD